MRAARVWATAALSCALLASSPAVTGCTSSVLGAARTPGQVVVALADAPTQLDPTTSATFAGTLVLTNLCEALLDIDDQQRLVPRLAASMPQVSPDGLTVTITLRSGVRFNDGTPLDAPAVATSLRRDLTLPTSQRTGDLGPVTEVEPTGPLGLRLRLARPYAPLLSALAGTAGMVMSPTALGKLGEHFGDHPVCVGPFAFARRPTAGQVDLVRSPYYYDRAHVYPSAVSFRTVVDSNVRVAELRAGDVDVVDRVMPADVEAVRHDRSARVAFGVSLGYQALVFNIGNAHGSHAPPGEVASPFAAHPELRRALELTLDRTAISRVVFNGQYPPDCTPFPLGTPWSVRIPCDHRDVAQARRLVAASGVPTPIRLALMTPSVATSEQLATLIQAMAADAGFAVSVVPTELATSVQRAIRGQFTAYLSGWSGYQDPDGNVYSQYHPGEGLNLSGVSDPALTALLEQARRTTAAPARIELYRRIALLLNDRQYMIYLAHPRFALGARADLTGVRYLGSGQIRLAGARRVGR
jgi:peptide/nickel transport system substrate-binding protein